MAISDNQMRALPSVHSSQQWLAAALESALRMRAPRLHASTPMVRQLAAKVGRELDLDAERMTLLDTAVRLRDVGMLALPDSVILAITRLTPADWELVNRHPQLSAEMLLPLDPVASAAPIVLAHHERWDGEGYPAGSRAEGIPQLSRLIATCDAFVALASNRPHRRGIGAEAALEHVCQERGSQFDPEMVDALVAVLTGKANPTVAGATTSIEPAASDAVARPGRARRRDGFKDVIAELDPLPAFAPALDRLLDVAASESGSGGDLVEAVESDTGLTVAILRRAQEVAARNRAANVADAVAALGAAGVVGAVEALPRTEFPWRTSPLAVLMHFSRVHSQAVTRAADRIVAELDLAQRDDILVAALLHDIGKLVLGRARSDYSAMIDNRTTSPEKRIRLEQQALGMDHASMGGLVLRRWGLPRRLADTVTAHHSAETPDEVATYVRLADMIAHHAQGETIDRDQLLRLCRVCGLSVHALTNVLFDLPQSGGSRRRRAEPSPLSTRETAVLRILAQGKVYKAIARELGLATSTVRSHLHSTYAKLGVEDRAQAVLRATEMGWI